jgi:high frequency lysogenization protein
MNIKQSSIDQAVALAGIAQAIRSVQNIAWKGSYNATDFKAMVASLLKLNAASAVAVYSGSFEVSTGLRIIKQQLDTSNSDKDPEFIQLIISLLSLHKQLLADSAIYSRLESLIKNLTQKYQGIDVYNDEEQFEQLVVECSAIYKQTLSKLPSRIQVKGDPQSLKPEQNQNLIRCGLLCAMRSVFLWRQSGGSRWHFLFKKEQILNATKQLMSSPIKE